MISYYTINSILTNKLESSIQSNLSQVTLSLENSLSGLNHISQQFAYEGRTVKELDELIRTEESFNRMKLQHQFKSKLNLITSTNPDIGLAMYYFEKDQSYRFANFPVKYSFSSGKLPLLPNLTELFIMDRMKASTGWTTSRCCRSFGRWIFPGGMTPTSISSPDSSW